MTARTDHIANNLQTLYNGLEQLNLYQQILLETIKHLRALDEELARIKNADYDLGRHHGYLAAMETGIPGQRNATLKDARKAVNTHAPEWLRDGYTHCQHGSRKWCEGYLNSVADFLDTVDRILAE